jgi:hypothetical protein
MSRDVWAAVAATVAVSVVVVLGFRVLGGPANQRLVQADLRKMNTLSQLAQQINQRWTMGGKTLPDNLEKFPNSLKQDPVSGKAFVYHAKSNDEYELCATFATDDRDARMHTAADRWMHPKGDFCFQFQTSEQVPWVPYNY